MKPSVFIGSSKEALPLANAIRDELNKDFEAEVWADDIFTLGSSTLTELLRFVQYYDFGILLITADDVTKSRMTTTGSPRDNVILELGMFTGALGIRRTFAILQKSDSDEYPKLPSDLLGISNVILPKDHAKTPDLSRLSDDLKILVKTIQERSKESYLELLPSTGLAIGYFTNFVLPACKELEREDKIEVAGAIVDISNDNFDFKIVLPKNLNDASIEGARKFAKNAGVAQVTLKMPSRSYPLYVSSALEKGRVQLYDYPTTLRASHEAIRIAFSGPYLGASSHQTTFDKKEIANFEKTLRILLQNPEAANFRDNVHIITAP